MRYAVECADRTSGAPYVVEVDASDPRAAVSHAAAAGHVASRSIPVHGRRAAGRWLPSGGLDRQPVRTIACGVWLGLVLWMLTAFVLWLLFMAVVFLMAAAVSLSAGKPAPQPSPPVVPGGQRGTR